MKTTLTIIAYDISHDKRRNKVHKLLLGFGKWTQFSLFECFLSEKEWVRLRHELTQLIDSDQDSLRVYRLCQPCQEQVETIGGKPPPEEDQVFLI